MNARQTIEVNQQMIQDLLDSAKKLAELKNISIADAIDYKVSVSVRFKCPTATTIFQNYDRDYINIGLSVHRLQAHTEERRIVLLQRLIIYNASTTNQANISVRG